MKTTFQKTVLFIGFAMWLTSSAMAGPPSPFRVAATLETRDGTNVVRFQFAVPPEHTLYPARMSFQTGDGRPLTPLSMPEPVLHHDQVSGQDKQVYDHSFTAEFQLGSPLPASVIVKMQGCSNGACYFPEKHVFNVTPAGLVAQTEPVSAPVASGDATQVAAADQAPNADGFKVAGRQTGYLSRSSLLTFLDDARNGRGVAGEAVEQVGRVGLLTTLFLILLGGVGLNLTPCVLPMIPINLAIIGAGAQAGSRQRGFALGATYGAGMALVYGVLGLVVVLTGSKFGTLNSSGWFNLVIALVFAVMGLAMFDVVNVDFSRFQSNVKTPGAAQKSKFVLAFSIGVIAALLAGACVAPVVISVLVLAAHLYGKGVFAGLLLPFLLGVGMALPWPFAGAGLSFLPKPGKWMKYVKYSFGTLIFLFAAYYVHLAVHAFTNRPELMVSARTAGSPSGAQTASPNELLAAALQQAHSEGRPVFIDFAASWCKNCAAMDAAVFPAPEVKQQLKKFVVVKYDAEQPNESPARETLDRFGVMGLPTYVVLLPQK